MSFLRRRYSGDGNYAPRPPFELNKGSQQAQNLILWVPPGSPATNGTVFDLSLVGENGVTVGSPPLRVTPFSGLTHEFIAGDESLNWSSPSARLRDLPTTHDFSVSCWCVPDTNDIDRAAWSWEGTDDLVMYPNDSSVVDGIRIFWRDVAGSSREAGGSDRTGETLNIVFVSRASNNHEIFLNGESVHTFTNTGTAGPFSTFHIGSFGGNVQEFNGIIWDTRVYAKALNDAEIWALYNPASRWELYYETGRVTYFIVPAAAVGGNPGASSLALTGVGF